MIRYVGSLIGFEIRVKEASNKYLRGLEGKVIDESRNTIVIKSGSKYKRIPKKGAIFIIRINDEFVEVIGDKLIGDVSRRWIKIG